MCSALMHHVTLRCQVYLGSAHCITIQKRADAWLDCSEQHKSAPGAAAAGHAGSWRHET